MTTRAAILLLESDKSLLDFLSLCFSPHYDVYPVEDTAGAIDLLARVRIDLMLLDLDMPTTSGLKFIQRIQKNPKRRIPIVAISPYSYSGELPHGIQVDDLLGRPFSITALRRAVERNIPISRQQTDSASFNWLGAASALLQ